MSEETEKYEAKGKAVQQMSLPGEQRFYILQRNKFLTLDAKSIDDFIETFEKELLKLKEWKRRGVILDPDSNIHDDYAEFVTNDPEVAKAFGFVLPPLF